MIVSPSIASGDMMHIADEVDFINRCFRHMHIDIEDGMCVPNISFGFKTARGICKLSTGYKSLHIMVANPLVWIDDVARCGADVVFVHTGRLEDPAKVMSAYRAVGINVGLGLSDRDLKRDLSEALKLVDEVMMLTAFVDDPNQKFSRELMCFAQNLCGGRKLWLDGGINEQVLSLIGKDSCYAAVMGRGVFNNRERAVKLYGKKN